MMKALLHILMYMIMALLLVCCRPSLEELAMDRASSLMESRPDSAISVLDSIDASMLHSKKDMARYALLKSMALDKNGIDRTDFDVLQPAIDYYLKQGSPDEKLKTYYYQGRIYQNQGDRDKAFGAFMRGLDIADVCRDSLLIVRTLVAQGCIYHDMYDFESYIHTCLKAADLAHKMGKKDYQFQSLLYILNGATLSDNKVLADSVDRVLAGLVPVDEDHIVNRIYTYRLPYITSFGADSHIKDFLDAVTDHFRNDPNNSLGIAGAYIKLGENGKAEEALRKLKDAGIPYDTLRYLALSVKLLRNQQKYEDALSAYMDFNMRSDLNNFKIFNLKRNAVQDKYGIEIAALKAADKKSKWIFLCIVGLLMLAMILVAVLFVMHKGQVDRRLAVERAKTLEAERENLIHRVSMMEEEKSRLDGLLKEARDLPESTREVIVHRLKMLNSLLSGSVASIDILSIPFQEWIEELKADRQKFLNENRKGFTVLNPHFINYLNDKELTTEEINYVCLYALGMNGTEITDFLKMPGFRNKTKEIRRKLGLGIHDTNLKKYIHELLKTE